MDPQRTSPKSRGSARINKKRPSKPLLCGSCTECCRGPRELELLPEDWGKYREYYRDGKVFLARKENQDCVYLGEGCTIHEDKPQTCRRFDCREWVNHPEVPNRVKFQALKRL